MQNSPYLLARILTVRTQKNGRDRKTAGSIYPQINYYMNRFILIASFCLGLMPFAKGQRLVLVEEFSGENCGTCAVENPAFNALMQENVSKALLLRYMVPIPSAGPIYYQNTGLAWLRMMYYRCNFAPWGEVDGKVVGTGQYPAFIPGITQTSIDNAHDVTPPMKITLTPYFNKAKDSIIAVVKITATQNYNKAGAKLNLRVALVESLHFATAPGNNGEKDFDNVVRRTYPDANGNIISSVWSNGQTQTFTIRGLIPTYVNKANQIFVAAWVQNDSTKEVLQTQKSNINEGPTGVNNNGSSKILANVFPNPANNATRMELQNDHAQTILVRIADALGREVYRTKEQFFPSGFVGVDVPTKGMAPGLYYVTVYSADGSKSLPLRVMH
jgi:hypothetical protein